MLFSRGTWKMSTDGKYIILYSFETDEVFKGDTAAYFVLPKGERIEIVKNKLVYKDIVLTEEHWPLGHTRVK